MNIKLNITRIIIDDTIMEIFTWSPINKYAIDAKFQLYHILRDYRNEYALHRTGNVKLIDINYLKNKVIYTYKLYKDKFNFKLSEELNFDYFPILGEKKCSVCLHIRKYRGKNYCYMKSKAIKKKSWYKCLYWEQSNKEYVNVSRQRKAKRISKNNGGIS